MADQRNPFGGYPIPPSMINFRRPLPTAQTQLVDGRPVSVPVTSYTAGAVGSDTPPVAANVAQLTANRLAQLAGVRKPFVPTQPQATATQQMIQQGQSRRAMLDKVMRAEAAKRQTQLGGAGDVAQAQQGGLMGAISDPTSPAGQALSAAAATGLQLSGYTDRPRTLGQNIGAMMTAGQQAYADAQEKKLQIETLAAQREQDLAIKKLELQAAQAKASSAATETQFKQEKNLRDTFDKRSGTFEDALAGFEKVQKAALTENPSGATDLALIFGFMKTIDPGSVVREGEFATAENSGGVGAQVRNLYNKIVEGDRLDPVVRVKFINAAREQIAPALERQNQLELGFTELADSYGLDATKVVLSRIPDQGTMVNPFVVDREDAVEDLPAGSYVYINGRFARVD